jgi:hypothetical protein
MNLDHAHLIFYACASALGAITGSAVALYRIWSGRI